MLNKLHAQKLAVQDDSIRQLNKSWKEEAEQREKLAIDLATADKKLEVFPGVGTPRIPDVLDRKSVV